MGKYLKRWGFTPQRPLKKAYEQLPAAVSKWVHEEYPKITAKARQEARRFSVATRQAFVPMTCVVVVTRRR